MANTGYLAYNTLEEYDTATGVATGNTKPNVDTDPDYIAPVYDTSSCPVPDTESPRITNFLITSIGTDSIGLSWDASDNVAVTSQVLHYKPYGLPWASITLSGSIRAHTLVSLIENTVYDMYIVPSDAAGNEGISELLRTTTKTNKLPEIHLAGGINGTGYSTSNEACGQSTITTNIFWERLSTNPYPSGLDKVYTDSTGTTAFNGSSNWWAYNKNRIIQIDSAGVILKSYDCTQTLSVSPTSESTTSTASSFTVTITSNSTWEVSESESWLSIVGASGSGNDTFTVDIAENTGSARNGTIIVRNLDGYNSTQISVSQYASVYTHQLGYGADSATACSGTKSTYYTNNPDFYLSTEIYTDSAGTTFANGGYYSDGTDWIDWDGTNKVLGGNGFCGF